MKKIMYFPSIVGFQELYCGIDKVQFKNILIKLIEHNITWFENLDDVFSIEKNPDELEMMLYSHEFFMYNNSCYTFTNNNDKFMEMRMSPIFHHYMEYLSKIGKRETDKKQDLYRYYDVKEEDLPYIRLFIDDPGVENILFKK